MSNNKELKSSFDFAAELVEEIKSDNQSDIFKSASLTHINEDSEYRDIEVENLVEAPKEWNFYSPLKDDKMIELIESVVENGLLTPIIVWEQENDKFMILAGHNRVKAYEIITEELDLTDFKTIKAIVKKKDEINIEQAKQIIVDTNWVQRELSGWEKHQSIVAKYNFIEENVQRKKGVRVRDLVAEKLDMKGRQVENYYKLASLIPEMQNMYKAEKVTLAGAAKISLLKNDIQRIIASTVIDSISTKMASRFNNEITEDNIDNYINDHTKKVKKAIKITFAEEDEDRFMQLLMQMISDNGLTIGIK